LVAEPPPDPIPCPKIDVQILVAGRGHVDRTGDCCVVLICETGGPQPRVQVLDDLTDPSGSERIDVVPWPDWASHKQGETFHNARCAEDIEAMGVAAAKKQLDLGRPVVVLYYDNDGWLHVVRHGDVVVTAAEHNFDRQGEALSWTIRERSQIDRLVTVPGCGFHWADLEWCQWMAGVEPDLPFDDD